jgi:hypothetical protein
VAVPLSLERAVPGGKWVAEESAMHYDDDGGEEEELSEDVLHDLEDFED